MEWAYYRGVKRGFIYRVEPYADYKQRYGYICKQWLHCGIACYLFKDTEQFAEITEEDAFLEIL
jgi:hypothetical protein